MYYHSNKSSKVGLLSLVALTYSLTTWVSTKWSMKPWQLHKSDIIILKERPDQK